MNYNRVELMDFIGGRLGVDGLIRFGPKVDRLVTLYVEFDALRVWLECNKGEVGSKLYKENVSVLNALLMNINRLEDDLELFLVRDSGIDVNPLMKLRRRESSSNDTIIGDLV